MTVESLITQHIDTWTSAVKTKSTTGRGSSKKLELYGVKKLRELILELAVRGKLVPQDPSDEPALELLFKSLEVKDALMKQGIVKKTRSKKTIKEEHFYNYPDTWAVSKLEDLIHVVNGRAYKKAEMLSEGTPILRVGNLFTSNDWYYSDLQLEADKYIDDGDLIYAWSASFGPFIWDGGKVIYHYHIWKMDIFRDTSLDKEFSKLFLQAISERIKASGNGIAMIHMTKERMEKVMHPLPPINEQKRIVSRVNELMTLCDQLEQQTEASIEAHQLLVSTLLNTLTHSADADELMENWARISDHFDTLFTTEESIDQLKQTILQLAVMGKLVPQDPNDEPASVLLERIAEEKAQLIKEKKIKKQKALPPIADDEKPFDLPTGWEWCRTIDAGDIKLGRQRSPKDHSGPYMTPYLRVANVHDNRIDTTDVKEMNFTPEEQKTFSLEYGDILLNEGQSKELVGRPAMYRNEIPGACFQNTLLRFKVWSGVNAEFSLLYFRHCLYSGRFQKAVKQTTNMAHLSAARLIPIEFPLPPEKEQIRIVAKVEQLTEICNQLNIRLRDFQTTQLHLTDTIVEQAV